MKKWHYTTLSIVLVFGGMLASAFVAEKTIAGAVITLIFTFAGGLILALLGEQHYPTINFIYIVKDNEGVLYNAFYSETRANNHRDYVQSTFERSGSRKIARVIKQQLK